ncbi:MAG: sulfotransferase [Phycisphaerales bacterium]
MIPSNADQLFHEAMRLHHSGELDQAERLYRRLLKQHRDHPDLSVMYGRLLVDRKEVKRGLDMMRKVIKKHPQVARLHLQRGLGLLAAQRIDSAIKSLGRARELEPNTPELHFHLAHAYLAQFNSEKAIECLRRAVQLDSENAQYRYHLATTLLRSGRIPVDTSQFEWLIERDPNNAVYHMQLGNAHQANGDLEKARAEYERSVHLDPDQDDAQIGLANIEETLGNRDRAYEILRACIDSGVRKVNLATAFARVCRARNIPREAAELIAGQLEDETLAPTQQIALLFRLGQLYEDMKEYESAWGCYKRTNDLHPKTWDGNDHEKGIDALIEVFTKERFAGMVRSKRHDRLPVFIVGMYRSGTTLLEQIVSCHSQVCGAGELVDMMGYALTLPERIGAKQDYPRCLEGLTQDVVDEISDRYLRKLRSLVSSDAVRVTDKMPLNYLHLGWIKLLLPQAIIIHCRRDPLDTCFSCYANSFSSMHGFTTDLGELGRTYRQYDRLISHWRDELEIPMLEVEYEELVHNQEAVSRRVIQYLGLDWEEACLRFHESSRVTLTLSEGQVRQPMFKTSIGRADRFGAHLDPLREALGQLIDP